MKHMLVDCCFVGQVVYIQIKLNNIHITRLQFAFYKFK